MGKKRKTLVDKINQILGTKFEFRGVALKELEELHDAISAKIGAAAQGLPIGGNIRGLMDTPIVKILKKKLTDKNIEDLTLKDLLSAVQGGTENKGILGLGLIPRLLRGRK